MIAFLWWLATTGPPATALAIVAALDQSLEAAVFAGLVAILGGIAHILLRLGRLEGKVDILRDRLGR